MFDSVPIKSFETSFQQNHLLNWNQIMVFILHQENVTIKFQWQKREIVALDNDMGAFRCLNAIMNKDNLLDMW